MIRRIRTGYYAAGRLEVVKGLGLNDLAKEKIGSVMGATNGTKFMYLGKFDPSEIQENGVYHGYDTTVIIGRAGSVLIFGEKVKQIEAAHNGLEKLLSTKLMLISLT